MSEGEYQDNDDYEDDHPKRVDLLRIAVACMAAAFGVILYCSIRWM